MNKKALIVYFTRTGNTAVVAETLQQVLGTDRADLLAIRRQPAGPTDYQAEVDQNVQDQTAGHLPGYTLDLTSLADYDDIFLGFPTWNMALPQVLLSFLTDYPLGQRTCHPFNTNGGYGLGRSLEQIRQYCPQANIRACFTRAGGHEKQGQRVGIQPADRPQLAQELADWVASSEQEYRHEH
ncbi:flavodoxin [Leuconostocaceae bacterium ESL0958]|nr:flavodoxin [Leuconostocaceae bacterium ESL0958]